MWGLSRVNVRVTSSPFNSHCQGLIILRCDALANLERSMSFVRRRDESLADSADRSLSRARSFLLRREPRGRHAAAYSHRRRFPTAADRRALAVPGGRRFTSGGPCDQQCDDRVARSVSECGAAGMLAASRLSLTCTASCRATRLPPSPHPVPDQRTARHRQDADARRSCPADPAPATCSATPCRWREPVIG